LVGGCGSQGCGGGDVGGWEEERRGERMWREGGEEGVEVDDRGVGEAERRTRRKVVRLRPEEAPLPPGCNN
jgi:hypothetical protein